MCLCVMGPVSLKGCEGEGRRVEREGERGASGQRFAFLRGAIISPAVSVQQWGQISRVRSVDH